MTENTEAAALGRELAGGLAGDWRYGAAIPDPGLRDLVGLKARWIAGNLPSEPKSEILEFGCGEGKNLGLVRRLRPESRLVGVDIVAPGPDFAFEFHKIGADETLPFAADSFDVVLCNDVLEHVESIDRALAEITRILRPGGRLIGFVPVEGGISAHSLFRLFDRDIYRRAKDHRHAYTARDLRARFASHFGGLDFRYSYHVFGGLLDAAFFAAFALPGLGRRLEDFWRGADNPVYRHRHGERPPTWLGRLVIAASRLAYWESRLLHRFPVMAIGLHFQARNQAEK